MDEKSEKYRFPKEFAGAFALTFFNEFNRIHHGANAKQAILSSFITALLLAMMAHVTRGKKRQMQWKYAGLFGISLAIAFLIERQKMGNSAHWPAILSSSFTIAIWISAALFLMSAMWREAEGQTE
jgi:hypothetical protein